MAGKNLAARIELFIKDKKYSQIKSLFPSHPEDIANLISQFSTPSHKLLVFRLVPADKAVDVFECLPSEEEEQMLNSLNSQEIRNILNEMSPDDRTELFEEMPAELVRKFVNLLSPLERAIAIELLNYPAESIGRLLTPDFVQLYESMTVEEALSQIRSVGLKKETVYHCYVLDKGKKLIGVVSLKKLVLADPAIRISDIMFTQVVNVSAYKDKEEAANIFKKYDLIALPVVDNNNKLLGIVTFDDLVDVIEDETTEDFERIAAVLPVEKPYMDANFGEIVWKRSFWLIVLTVLGSVSSLVLQRYSVVIHRWVALTFFLPILVATGGNAGTQSAMMIIRGLATGDITIKDFFRVVWRESMLGFCIGGILAVIGLVRVILQQNNWLLSISVGVSMGITIMLSAIIGAALPMIFQKFKLDPALMSGPLIATIVDVVGILMYFEIARRILGM